jgi:hypothetical protein
MLSGDEKYLLRAIIDAHTGDDQVVLQKAINHIYRYENNLRDIRELERNRKTEINQQIAFLFFLILVSWGAAASWKGVVGLTLLLMLNIVAILFSARAKYLVNHEGKRWYFDRDELTRL